MVSRDLLAIGGNTTEYVGCACHMTQIFDHMFSSISGYCYRGLTPAAFHMYGDNTFSNMNIEIVGQMLDNF